MAEVVRGRLDDLGKPEGTEHATLIGTDNDATRRIASDAAAAKRAVRYRIVTTDKVERPIMYRVVAKPCRQHAVSLRVSDFRRPATCRLRVRKTFIL